jgi:serine/threonine-protein kinase
VFSRAFGLSEGQVEPTVPLFAAYLYASRGERDRIDPAVLAQRPDDTFDGDAAYWIGGVFALLGETAPALAWLRRAVEIGNHNYPFFRRDRNYDRLHGHPEYEDLMARVRREWDRYRLLFGRE